MSGSGHLPRAQREGVRASPPASRSKPRVEGCMARGWVHGRSQRGRTALLRRPGYGPDTTLDTPFVRRRALGVPRHVCRTAGRGRPPDRLIVDGPTPKALRSVASLQERGRLTGARARPRAGRTPLRAACDGQGRRLIRVLMQGRRRVCCHPGCLTLQARSAQNRNTDRGCGHHRSAKDYIARCAAAEQYPGITLVLDPLAQPLKPRPRHTLTKSQNSHADVDGRLRGVSPRSSPESGRSQRAG